MTAQISDYIKYERRNYDIVAVENEIPFSVEDDLKLEPVSPHSACWRGYYLVYSIKGGKLYLKDLHINLDGEYPEINGVSIKKEEDEPWYKDFEVYKNVNIPINYTGGIILARDFLDKYYIHMGFQEPHAYETVIELTFREGVLIEETNHSDEMAKLRKELSKKDKEKAEWNLIKFIDDAFSLDYDIKWREI